MLLSRRHALVLAGSSLFAPQLARAAEQVPPRRGGTFIMAAEGEPATLTAHLSSDTPTNMAANNIFNGLVLLSPDLDPIPDLAESWTVSEDGRVYTFKLRRDVSWHDGKPFSSADVEFTFNEILAKVNPQASSWWPNVEVARALDPATFEIRLKQPYAPFLTMLGFTLASGALIMPKHIYQGTDPRTNPANRRPIGTGPFKFSAWERGNYVELTRNDHYWGAGKPYLDRVLLQMMPDPSARLLAFEKGEVDFLHWYILPYERMAQIKSDPRFKLVGKGNAPSTISFVLMNLRHPALKNTAVRSAIARAIDRETIRQKAMFGQAAMAHSHLGSGLTHFYTAEYDDLAFDAARANRMLDEAGFPRDANGRRFALRLSWGTGRDYEGRTAEVIKSNLRDVGIDVTIVVNDRLTFNERTFMQWDFDMAMQLYTTGPDPTIGVRPRYHSKEIRKAMFVNAFGYVNGDLDAIFDREQSQTDLQARVALWHDAQRILMQDLPSIPLFEIPPVHAVSATFVDAVTGPQGYVERRENAYQIG